MKAAGPNRESRNYVNQVSKIVARVEQRGIEAGDLSRFDEIVKEMYATLGIERPQGTREGGARTSGTPDGGDHDERSKKAPRAVVERSDVILPSAQLVAAFCEHAAFRIIPEGMKASCPVAVTGDRGPAVLVDMFHPAVRTLSQLPLTTCKMSRGQRRLELSDIELERYLRQNL